jgi:hypothetical protein
MNYSHIMGEKLLDDVHQRMGGHHDDELKPGDTPFSQAKLPEKMDSLS